MACGEEPEAPTSWHKDNLSVPQYNALTEKYAHDLAAYRACLVQDSCGSVPVKPNGYDRWVALGRPTRGADTRDPETLIGE